MENKGEKIWKKWCVLGVIILLLMIISFTGTDKENEEINNKSEDLNVQSTEVNKEEKEEEKYADDSVINNFIKSFKTVSNYELTDIRRGNIKTKYSLVINEQYCQLLNAIETQANYFEIIINGGNEKDDFNEIVNVYKEVIKALDSTIEETKINDTISTYINSKTSSTSFNINDKISVKVYPSVSLSYGNTDCRIEITTTIYN